MPIGTIQWKYYKAVKTLKLALGNLTISLLFAISFVMSKKIVKEANISQEIKNELIVQEEKETEETDTTTTKKENNLEQATMKNTLEDKQEGSRVENILQNKEENTKLENGIQKPVPIQSNATTPIISWHLLGISALFFLISIIFFIIFQKRQQKGDKKASK